MVKDINYKQLGWKWLFDRYTETTTGHPWTPEHGQITPDSLLGAAIEEYSRKSEVIVECGPWYGLGTTWCIALGVERPTQRVFCVDEYEPAIIGCRHRYVDDPRFMFILGDFNSCVELLPKRIDLFVMDGGGKAGYSNFMNMKDRIKWFASDDTANEKAMEARKFCIENGWKIYLDDFVERCGHGSFVAEHP